MKYGFIIDNRKCIGCHACTVACKAEHDVPVGVNRTWVKYIEKGEFPNTTRNFSVMRCNHCEDAPCLDICPVSALFYRKDGIVDFDSERCIGCKGCMQACPYDALYIDPETHTAAKCNYCAHRIDVGLEPACVNVCPEEAILSGDLDDPNSKISMHLATQQVTARKVDKGTKPKLFYIDGDSASLNPTQTSPSNQYLWSSQSSGVGHFVNPCAKFPDLRANAGRIEIHHHDRRSVTLEAVSSWPANKEALADQATRVYDAPQKGLLWGWEVVSYVWTKALSAGVFLILFSLYGFGLAPVPSSVQWFGVLVSLFFLTITTVLLVMDLDRPSRFLYVVLRPQWRSWLVKGAYILMSYAGVLTLWIGFQYFGLKTWANFLVLLGLPLALFAAVYTAFLLAQGKGRDLWQSPLLGLHMMVHSFMAGSAFLLLTSCFWQPLKPLQGWFTMILTGSILFHLFSQLIEFLTPHSTADARKAMEMMTHGPYKHFFWFLVLFLGNILPLVFMVGFSTMAWILPLTSVLVLMGIWLWVHLWIKIPQLIPLS